jgi:hypothetical protein
MDSAIAIAGSTITRYPEVGSWRVTAQVRETGMTLTAPLEVTFTQ